MSTVLCECICGMGTLSEMGKAILGCEARGLNGLRNSVVNRWERD